MLHTLNDFAFNLTVYRHISLRSLRLVYQVHWVLRNQ